MKKIILAIISIAMLTFLAGCLGSDESSGGSDEPVAKQGQMDLTGSQTTLAQIEPVQTEIAVDIPLDYPNVIMIQVNLTVTDGDDNTNPDQVGEVTLSEAEEGNHTKSTNGGTASPETPFTTSLSIEWDGTNYMKSRWSLNIPVTIAAGDDQWPGPLIWNGVPDQGFSYEVNITYQYHPEED